MHGKGRILIVDDDAIAAEVVRARLVEAGYEVVIRHEALGTCGTVLNDRPDAVLMDLHLPAIDGDRLATLVHNLPGAASIPIILCSSDAEGAMRARARVPAIVGSIAKSSRDREFIQIFEALLEHHRRLST